MTIWAERALQHVKFLAERIGPRGATTPEEKRAAEYVQTQLLKIGAQEVRLETFRAPRSGWLPFAIMFSTAVWGSFICWGNFYLTQIKAIGAVIGAALCLAGLWIIYRQITFKDHWLRRRFPKASSVNALGRIPAAGEVKHCVVLVAQIDSAPAAFIFQTRRRISLFKFCLRVSFISLIAGLILFLLGGFDVWNWGFTLAGVCGLLQSAGILLSIQADQGDYSPGANDNASGVGTILTLAERLCEQPLAHTEVWIAGCGSHTIDGSGLRALIDQHVDELRRAWFIGFEGVGIGNRLITIVREGWLRRSITPAVRDLLDRVSQARSELLAQPRSAVERYTPVGPANWRGYNSLCISLYAERDGIPNWHHAKDKASYLQPTALNKAHEFGWELLKQIEGME